MASLKRSEVPYCHRWLQFPKYGLVYTGSPFRSDPRTKEFYNILGDFFPINRDMSATHGLCITEGNILDLVFTNNEFLVGDVSVHPNAFDSDHFPLAFTLVAKSNRPKNVQRKVYCYKSADYFPWLAGESRSLTLGISYL